MGPVIDLWVIRVIVVQQETNLAVEIIDPGFRHNKFVIGAIIAYGKNSAGMGTWFSNNPISNRTVRIICCT